MSNRFAIVGCGSIASRHAEQIRSAGQLIAVCDIDPQRSGQFSKAYGANAYDSLGELLKQETPDIVVVCTPNGLHAEHSIAALRAGCHVLCEKPLAITATSAREMVKEAEKAGRKLFVVKQNRFNPPVKAVKKLLDEGRLGRITSFQINCFWNRPDRYYEHSWHGTRDLDGGILFTQFSHFIDLLYWFLGRMDSATGWRANYLHRTIAIEDTGAAVIAMKSGAIGTIQYTINSHASNMEGSFTLFGEKGTVKIGGQYLNRIDHFSVENEHQPEPGAAAANQYGYYTGSMSNHHIVYDELLKALNDPAHAAVEASEALESVVMIGQIYAASPFIQNAQG